VDGNFRVGQWLVQPQLNLIQGPGGETSVEPKAMEVLVCLAQQAGEVVPKERLMQTVWADTFVTDEVLTNSIWELRKVFGDDAKKPKVIQTVFKKGYRLIAPVSLEGKNAEIRPTLEQPQPEPDMRSAKGPPFNKGRLQGDVHRKWIIAWIAVALLIAAAVGLRSSRGVPSAPPLPPKVVPLTSLKGSEIQPSFSPDGNQVAFAWNGEKEDNYDIYVKLTGSEKLLRLTTDSAHDLSPVWSPDGRHIAFTRHSAGQRAVILIPALGGPERRLHVGTERSDPYRRKFEYMFQQPLSWSVDSKALAVTESSTDAPDRVLMVSIESREVRALVSSQSSDASLYSIAYRNPRVSPTGQVLAYLTQGSDWSRLQTLSLPLPSREQVPLVSTTSDVVGMDWTADGREIIFSSAGFLWRIGASGGNPERLAIGGDGSVHPAVARRGNLLAYAQGQLDTNIWRVHLPHGSTAKPTPELLIASTRTDAACKFSPDGKRIVFGSSRSGTNEIWVSEADGSNARQITSSQQAGSPRWSPDGQFIAFDQIGEGNRDIYVVSADGGKPKQLTTDRSDDVRPSWSRDGRWIYFGSIRSGQWQVWKAPAAGGQAVQLTKQGGREAFESPDGKFVFYSKVAIPPRLWKVPVEGGVETPVLEGVVQGNWAVTLSGVYFLVREVTQTIKFYSFATKQTNEVAALGKNPTLLGALGGPQGFSVSPDGKQILYAQVDRAEYDIMLVENFR